LQDFAGRDIELETMRDGGTIHVKPSSEFRKISNQAIDRYAVELNRSGLENPSSWRCASFFHALEIRENSINLANRDK
jgi:hypothetical protein